MSNYFYYKLELYVYDQYSEYLLEVKQEIHTIFEHLDSSQWQKNTTYLANKLDSECNVISRIDGKLEDYVKSNLLHPQSKHGFVDMENGMVYYPLNEEFTLEIGPVSFSTWLYFFSEWFSWLTAIFLNAFLAFFYLNYIEKQRKKLRNTIINLPFDFDEEKTDVYHHIKQLASHIVELQQENESRLILQRDLLHGVAHEFRSPMARIQFALDMLEESPKNEQGKLRKSIHTSLDDLDKLVKELLYYARLKDSESALSYRKVSLVELCKSAIAQVSPFYHEISFELDELSFDTIDITADENLLKRMIVNLLRNAGRFATSTCRISLIFTEHEVTLVIEDDGVGIPPGKTSRIFEPFTRLDPSRSRDSGGCGLGLAIVDSIVKKHHGTIEVVNGKLAGACFRVSLPLTTSDYPLIK
jgi:two-component system sensor histidine kinase RstB